MSNAGEAGLRDIFARVKDRCAQILEPLQEGLRYFEQLRDAGADEGGRIFDFMVTGSQTAIWPGFVRIEGFYKESGKGESASDPVEDGFPVIILTVRDGDPVVVQCEQTSAKYVDSVNTRICGKGKTYSVGNTAGGATADVMTDIITFVEREMSSCSGLQAARSASVGRVIRSAGPPSVEQV